MARMDGRGALSMVLRSTGLETVHKLGTWSCQMLWSWLLWPGKSTTPELECTHVSRHPKPGLGLKQEMMAG